MTETAPRVEPVPPPFPPELQAVFDHIMPPGVPPLELFTTLARVPRVYDRFRAGSLLDRGPVSLRHREIAINRTCARCGCAYESGVHVAFFAQRVALAPEQIRATVRGDADDSVWSDARSSDTQPVEGPGRSVDGSGLPQSGRGGRVHRKYDCRNRSCDPAASGEVNKGSLCRGVGTPIPPV